MQIFKKLNSHFLKSVLVLVSGTVLAQAIGYLVSPFLTRIYSAEEMGELGMYMRLVGFFSALATARFELAIPLPKSDNNSFLLYKLSLRITKMVLLSLMVLLILFYFIKPLRLNEFVFGVFTIVSTLFVVYINLGTNWSIRKSYFKKISHQRIINSFTANGLKWVFGIFSMGSFGLILATLIGFIFSSFGFIRHFFRLNNKFKSNYSIKRIKLLAIEYKQFPKVNLPHVLVDLGRDLLIALLIVVFFGKNIFGLFNHSYMILKLPMVIVGASIGQVFFNKCSILVQQGKSTYGLMRRTLIILFCLSIFPFSIIFFYGEPLFAFVFSIDWSQSGYYSEIMTIWLMMNFLISPISSLPLVLKRQREFFFIGLFASISQIICFVIYPFFWGGSEDVFISMLWVLSISQAIILFGVICITLFYSKKGVRKN
ncbi:MAG: hypothetical protein CL844_04810 [Crocinitomicaceae bacterium]|nr:hypothetical protein [Crocinitomicaceae bacterium]|tara:strand:+ start:34735 stop:36015 length:1281 start_codon:yes stop_codon:yes gene_type:complete